MAIGITFRPLFTSIGRAGARLTSSWRTLSASMTTVLVGTWASHRAIFQAVPRDMRTADPTRASELIEGYIALANKVVELHGSELFDIDPPSDAFAAELYGFEWLRHMRAYELASVTAKEAQRIAARQAREYVSSWLDTRHRHPPLALTPQSAARRALSLTNHAAFLLDEADPQTYRAIMAGIMRDAKSAFTRRALVEDPTERCLVVVACAAVAHALRDHIALKQQTRDALIQALKETFHADGGPVTRRPGDLPLLLSEMLSLRALLEARGISIPPRLNQTIETGLRMLRMLRHPDGTLARFQGTTSVAALETDLVASVLFYDIQRGYSPIFAPQTGYARLEAPGSVLLMDCSGAPPLAASTQAHASALAFEWSHSNTKVITSAPEIGYTVDANMTEQRHTAAHSTLCLTGVSSADFTSTAADAQLIGRGLSVQVQKPAKDATRSIAARHTGYRRRFGVNHVRTLTLSENGRIVEGIDHLTLLSGDVAPAGRTPFALHFQLQPGTQVQHESVRRLRLSIRQQTIVFETDVGTITIEDPTNRSGYRGPARAKRIVVSGPSDGRAEVSWRFIVQDDRASQMISQSDEALEDRVPEEAQSPY